MRKANVLLAMMAGIMIAAGCGASNSTGSVAQASVHASCSRSIGTSANVDSVVITIHRSCSTYYRSVGLWGGGSYDGYHYGTYHGSGWASTACADKYCDAGNVQWGGYQRKSDGKEWCFYLCSNAPPGVTVLVAVHAVAVVACTNECVSWQYRGTNNPPDFRAEWVNGNSGGWFIRGVAHCADGRNEKLFLGGWVTSLNIWSEAHCQSPYLDEIGGAYDLKTCSSCSFTRNWKVGHAKQSEFELAS